MLNGIFPPFERFPGVDQLTTMLNIRSVGMGEHRETFGAGFIEKTKGIDFDQRSVDHYALVYVIKGHGRYIARDGQVHELAEGMIFQRRPDEIHSNYVDSQEWVEGFIALGRQLYRTLMAMGIIASGEVVMARTEDETRKLRIIEQFYHLAVKMSTFDEGEILSFLAEELKAVQALIRFRPAGDAVEAFCERAAGDPGRRFNLREFCEEQNAGYEWFRKEFKRRTGYSPGAWVVRERLRRAENLLTTTNLPVARVAEELGYTSPYEFSAQFKKGQGESPSAFRKKHALFRL